MLHQLFEVWLADMADKHNADTGLGNRAWKVFDQLADRAGACSPSDFIAFGPIASRVDGGLRCWPAAQYEASAAPLGCGRSVRRKAFGC